MSSRVNAAAAGLLAVAVLIGEPTEAAAQDPSPTEQAAAASSPGPTWSGSASVAGYFVPEDSNYLQPTVSADRGWLHLEARYNYEAQQTASFWAGVNFEAGERVTLALTPMFGIVIGDTDGVAPGLLVTLATWKLELYSEAEWVVDTAETSDSFFYNWSELTLQPVEWFRFGLVTQRTRAYQSDRDIQRGLLGGVMWRNASFTGHVFEPFSDQPTVVVSVAIEF